MLIVLQTPQKRGKKGEEEEGIKNSPQTEQ